MVRVSFLVLFLNLRYPARFFYWHSVYSTRSGSGFTSRTFHIMFLAGFRLCVSMRNKFPSDAPRVTSQELVWKLAFNSVLLVSRPEKMRRCAPAEKKIQQ